MLTTLMTPASQLAAMARKLMLQRCSNTVGMSQAAVGGEPGARDLSKSSLVVGARTAVFPLGRPECCCPLSEDLLLGPGQRHQGAILVDCALLDALEAGRSLAEVD